MVGGDHVESEMRFDFLIHLIHMLGEGMELLRAH